jgi:hypothetical protein
MKTEKPLRLIELLRDLIAEMDKMQIGQVYIAVAEEAKRITFVETHNNQFNGLVYKNLIQLAMKDFIHSGRSAGSVKILNEVIDVIAEAEIVVE